jgi:hypothetical protein
VSCRSVVDLPHSAHSIFVSAAVTQLGAVFNGLGMLVMGAAPPGWCVALGLGRFVTGIGMYVSRLRVPDPKYLILER